MKFEGGGFEIDDYSRIRGGADKTSKPHGVYEALYMLKCRPGVNISVYPDAGVLQKPHRVFAYHSLRSRSAYLFRYITSVTHSRTLDASELCKRPRRMCDKRK